MARVLRHKVFLRLASAIPHRLLIAVGAERAVPGVALAAALVAGMFVAGAASPARAVTAGLSFVEVNVRGGSDFPGNYYYEIPELGISADADCGPCGDSRFALFDPALGRLASVRIRYDGEFWGDYEDARYYYDDMVLLIEGNGTGFRVSDLITDSTDFDFSGEIVVPDTALNAFVFDRHDGSGYIDFSGNPLVLFSSLDNSAMAALGVGYDISVRYGYEPVVAPVPLPPAALLMLGSLGAVFAASRRRSGSAA